MTALSLQLPTDANPPAVESNKNRRENKPMPASLEGQTLGKYRILEPLGRGGMAQVYRAYHPQLDRYVAVKVLRSDLVEEVEFLARFRREAQSVANLRHPNIVQVYDFDMAFDYYYMVMELLEGYTLKVRLNEYRARGERLSLGEMLRVTTDILEGLAYAHSEGIVHRDIKPANILLSKRGQAVVTDFGIAQIVGGTHYTVSGALMGTLAYMAPEQGLHGTTSVQSDIYSLGIVLYEMLTGRPPFDADTPLAILMKHVNDPLPLPRTMDETIPEEMELIVLKALAKDPEDRYQSAGEMIQALQRAADQLGATLPDRISDPDFTIVGQPSGVAVLSGAAREQVTDVPLISDETDIDIQIYENVQDEAAPTMKAAEAATASGVANPLFTTDPAELSISQSKIKEAGKAFFPAIIILIAYNLTAVLFALIFRNWGIYDKGWTIEILIITYGLIRAMEATETPVMMIPIGILGGMGLLLSFYSITGLWHLWGVLWPLVPLLLLGTILYTFWLAARGERKAELIQWTAQRLSQLIFGVAIIVAGLSFIF
jgi:serine/threonine protein kinase